MKKICKLLFWETAFLKKTLAVILVILTAFSAALLAVISVLLDTPQGMVDGVDNSKRHYVNASELGGECFAVRLPAESFERLGYCNADLAYAEVEHLTQNTELSSFATAEPFETDIITHIDNASAAEYRVERHGFVVERSYSDALSRALVSAGTFETDREGVLLCDEIAEQLSVSSGDTVNVGQSAFTVLGVYDRNKVVYDYARYDAVMPSAWFYVVVEELPQPLNVFVTYCDTATTISLWHDIQRCGIDASIDNALKSLYDNIMTVQTYYGSVALLLGATTVFVMCALFGLFLRERKGQICRFKLLGATNATVAGIYCAIAAAIIVIAVAVASGLSVLLSKYFLGICTQLFGVEYAYRFRVWLPLAMLGSYLLFAAANFVLMQWRVSRSPVAQEVRCE